MSDDNIISGDAQHRHFKLTETLIEFSKLFKYDNGDDRSIVIVGATFIETIMEHILRAFYPENDKEVEALFSPEQILGTYGSKIRMLYCLGLIDKVIMSDLRLVGKIRNQFAHNLYASFSDQRIESWCRDLKWHKISMFMDPPPNVTARDIYQVGINQLITHLNGTISIARGSKITIKQVMP